jgi:hypothetical protein
MGISTMKATGAVLSRMAGWMPETLATVLASTWSFLPTAKTSSSKAQYLAA